MNACFNLERISRSSRLARREFRLWNGIDSDADFFHVPNLMHKLLWCFLQAV